MTISDGEPRASHARTVLGFLLGLAVIPAIILFGKPHADEVSAADFAEAPRDARFHWLEEISAEDRFDERVLVGSSIIRRGFHPRPDSRTLRLGATWMKYSETRQLVQNLMNRSRPPQIIIVDWSALHEVPHEQLLGRRKTSAYFSFDYLKFLLDHHFSKAGKSDNLGPSNWHEADATANFEAKYDFRKFLAYASSFSKHSRLVDFREDLKKMCGRTATHFVIVRFPVFFKGHEQIARENFLSLNPANDWSVIDQGACKIEFVDLLSQSLGSGRSQRSFQDENLWFDYN